MTSVIIDDVLPYTQSIATAAQTVFDTNWTVDAITDVVVYARATGVAPNDVTQTVSSINYTVTLVGVQQTVRVTFLVGRTLNDVVTITRNTPADRDNIYINTNFTPSMLNGDFGRQVLMIQQNDLYNTQLTPRYNTSATIEPVVDTILPILIAKQSWRKNAGNTAFEGFIALGQADIDPITFIVKTTNASVPAAQSLGALSTGILKNTTVASTGTLSIDAPLTAFSALAFAANKLPYATGAASFALADLSAYSITLIANTTLGAWQAQLGIPGGGTGVYLPLAGGTMTGAIAMGTNKITGLGTPTASDDAATMGFVLNVAQNVQLACLCAPTSNLAGYIYNNGTAGVGATLTAGSNGAFIADGISPIATNRVLLINQTDATQNGAYTLTTVGDAGTPAVLTRATDYNTPSQMQAGDIFSVVQGTTYAATQWMMSQVSAITIGTTNITFNQISGQGALLKANNLSDLPSVATARTNLGLVIGTNVQAYDATLQSISALGTAADKMIYTTGVDIWAEANITALGRTLLADATAAAMRATIGASPSALATNQIFVGSAGGEATAVAMSGDATIAASGAVTIANNAVTNAKAAQMATLTIKGNNTGGTANALDLTVAQVQAMLAPAWASYTPTVTLVGGAGNTVPTFTTQLGRWCKIGKTVFVQLAFLNDSGGTQGAGTGAFTVALPEAVGASVNSGSIGCDGLASTSATYVAFAVLVASATTCTVNFLNGTSSQQLTGAFYAASQRYFQMQFFYEVD